LALTFRTLNWRASATYDLLENMATMGLRPWGDISIPTVRVNAGVIWSLGFEWGFYLCLPALAAIVQSKVSPRILFLFAGLVALSANNHIFFFFPGVAAAYAARNPTIVRRLRSGYSSIFVILIVLAFPFITIHYQSWRGLFLTSLIFIPIACGNTLFGLLTLKGLRLIGIVSYSVYLLHGTSLYLACDLLGRVKHSGPNGTFFYWLCVDGLACATLVASICTYRWIELPFIEMEKRIRKMSMRAKAVVGTGTLPPEFKNADLEA
jgi:peptidoglycan/LPS O-acetylase OafA/YrhL